MYTREKAGHNLCPRLHLAYFTAFFSYTVILKWPEEPSGGRPRQGRGRSSPACPKSWQATWTVRGKVAGGGRVWPAFDVLYISAERDCYGSGAWWDWVGVGGGGSSEGTRVQSILTRCEKGRRVLEETGPVLLESLVLSWCQYVVCMPKMIILAGVLLFVLVWEASISESFIDWTWVLLAWWTIASNSKKWHLFCHHLLLLNREQPISIGPYVV